MAEEENPNAYSSSGSSGNDFDLLLEDDIASTEDLEASTYDGSDERSSHRANTTSESFGAFGISAPVDVEAIKRKAEELAKSLQKALSTVSKSASSSSSLENYEVRDDLKQHRERSLYVEQKLKEDRKLFEESKKRSEAVFDKVQSVKRIHESIAENVKELNRKDNDDSSSLKLKIQSLEDTVSRLQESLSNKNRLISEKNEQIRSLNQSVSDTHAEYMLSLEQSELEVNRVKSEYKQKIEDIVISKEELYHQLQLLRKNYLTVENDLKLSDFARTRLVNRNAELQEKIIALEKDNETLSLKLANEGDHIHESRESRVDDDLRPKIENLIIITNEFSTFLADDLADIVELDFADDMDISQAVDAVGDKLEAAFFTMRDKLSAAPKLQSRLEKMNSELKHMDSLLQQNREKMVELQRQLSATQTKLDEEIKEKNQLAESIRSSESWQCVSRNLNDGNQEIPIERNSDSIDTNLQLEQLMQECLHLNAELEAKSDKIQILTSTIDSQKDTIQKMQHDRQQTLNELNEKYREYENMRGLHNEVLVQLESLKEGQSRAASEQLQQVTHEYQLLQQTCHELHSKCDYLNAELQVKCEQLEKLSAHRSDEPLEKEENDFVVLQTRDCDEEDTNSLKRQCACLKEENEKLIAKIREMSEKAIEYENDQLTLQKYANECSRLQEMVKQLRQELEAAKKHLYNASVASRETEDDKDEEIECLQEEMAKLEQQLSKVWDKLHEEKAANHNLSEKLGSCEKTNASMSQMMQQQTAELEFLRKSNEELTEKIQSLSATSQPDELPALREHSFQLQKMLDLELSEHEATTNELESAKNLLVQYQTDMDVKLESVKSTNCDLQAEISQLSQQCHYLEDQLSEFSEMLATKDIELKRSSVELRETQTALNEVQYDLEFARNELEKTHKNLEDSQTMVDQTQKELLATKNDLKMMASHLQKSEESTYGLIEKHNCEVEALQNSVVALNTENAILRQQCEKYSTHCKNLQTQVSQIINTASRTSDDAINIVQRLQSQWPSPKVVADAEMQCSEELGADIQLEAETYELLLKDMREELTTLKKRYDEVKQELYQKDDECDAEVSRYGNLVDELRSQLSETEKRLTSAEREINQKNEDLLLQKQEFDSRVQFSEANYLYQLEQYQHQIEQFERFHESRKSETVDTSVQVSTYIDDSSEKIRSEEDPRFADIDLATNKVFSEAGNDQFDLKDCSETNDRRPGSDRESPGLIKYFGYYKEKMTKGLTEMLNPDEQTVDYSNWILPDQPIIERQLAPDATSVTPLVTEVVQRSAPVPRASISNILDQLQDAIAAQMNDDGWDVDEAEWNCSQLQLNDSEFVDTAFKFVDLFHIVITYYSSLPATDAVLEKFSKLAATTKGSTTSDLPSELSETVVTKTVDSRDIIEEVVTLAILLENKNKHLVDAISFLEELSSRPSEAISFQSVIEYWNSCVDINEDIIDRICEEYDIIPTKFIPGDQLVQWKEQMASCMKVIRSPSPPPQLPVETVCPTPIADNLQLLKKKMHKLICDLHYVYKDEETFNPVDFFAQIEDINHSVETTVKMVSSKEDKSVGQVVPARGMHEEHHQHHHEEHEHHHGDDHDHHKHDHDHHEHHHDHSSDHSHDHHDHDHNHDLDHSKSAQGHDERDTIADLKTLLGESNKKIDSLVNELMQIKSSREYNEVRQLHTKLDETLYQLHLRDVHVVELTRELTQLLSERDSLQLKLSNIIRQNEQLREIAVSNAASGTVMQIPDLENKLEELQAVNYMKDPRISEASKQYHVTGMQLYHEEQKSKEETSSSIVPSILKWFTSDTKN